MELCYAFDPVRYFLGDLCRNGHAFPGTTHSLRKAVVVPRSAQGYGPYPGTLCVGCSAGPFRGAAWYWRFLDCVASGLPAGSKLGKLCPRRHQYQDTQLSLREPSGHCLECRRERQRADGMNDNSRSCRRASQQKWRQSKTQDPAFVLSERLRTKARKVKQKGNHSLPVSAADIRHRFDEFGECCVFCNRKRALQIEHLLARAHGGPHVLGNLVPACAPCNSSKLDKDLETWYRAQPFFTEKRWRKILRVLGNTKGPVNQLPLL
jgi:5-methylcytosine-specific restriction endonuclease McrA